MSDLFSRRPVERFAPGDEEAFSELYRLGAQVLYNYAARVLMSADDAAHAVSGVFQSVWSGVPAWPDPAPPPEVVLASRMRESLLGTMRGAGRRSWRDVDLWSIVSARGADAPAAGPAHEAIRNCGVVSSAVLTMVYFGGHDITETARRLSMTESEARSRLQAGLERLAGGSGEARRPAPHGGKFLVNAAAWALGAVAPGQEAGYAAHLARGCPECRAEIERYSRAAHILPSLLPEVRLPGDLHERILFSVRLAGVAAAPDTRRERRPEGAAGPVAERPARGGTERPEARFPGTRSASRTGRRVAMAAGAFAAATILLLGTYVRSLSGRLEEQEVIAESLQERHTDLLLKYDHLAGISGFFESKGVVTVLSGTPGYPGLAGKIVWDTTDRSAMLQILDPPEELRRGSIRVSALGGDVPVRIAEFPGHGAGGDSGSVYYRFFPLDPGREIRGGEIAVDVSPEDPDAGGEYRSILRSAIAGR